MNNAAVDLATHRVCDKLVLCTTHTCTQSPVLLLTDNTHHTHKYHTLVLSTRTTHSSSSSSGSGSYCVCACASVNVNVTVRGCVRGKRKLRDEVKSLLHSAALQNTHHGRKAEQEH